MLREMAVGEVGHLWLLYSGMLVVVVETEVPTTCFKVLWALIWLTVWKACFACGFNWVIVSVSNFCCSGL